MEGWKDWRASRRMGGWTDGKRVVWQYMRKTHGNKEEDRKGKCMSKKGLIGSMKQERTQMSHVAPVQFAAGPLTLPSNSSPSVFAGIFIPIHLPPAHCWICVKVLILTSS